MINIFKNKNVSKKEIRRFIKKWEKTADYYLSIKQYRERAEILEMIKDLRTLIMDKR